MRLVIARLVWAFDMFVDPGKGLDWTQLKAMINIEKSSMPLRLKIAAVACHQAASGEGHG